MCFGASTSHSACPAYLRSIAGALLSAKAATAVALGAAATGIPEAGSPAGEVASVGSLAQAAAALVFVVLVILAVGWVLRRLPAMAQRGSGGLKVIGGVALGTKERVLLLQAGETQLLIGLTPGQLRTLHVFEKPVVTGDEPAMSQPSFSDRLGQALRAGRRP
jgi:flagellar protein FliO/FliZ